MESHPKTRAGERVLYLDDDSLWSAYSTEAINGNTVAAIPYTYKIG